MTNINQNVDSHNFILDDAAGAALRARAQAVLVEMLQRAESMEQSGKADLAKLIEANANAMAGYINWCEAMIQAAKERTQDAFLQGFAAGKRTTTIQPTSHEKEDLRAKSIAQARYDFPRLYQAETDHSQPKQQPYKLYKK